MSHYFKAAVLTKINEPLEIIELRLPKLESGQVLVQNRFSGICRSQLMEVTGQRGKDNWLPHLLGHESYGTVREIGPDVTKVSIGQKVVVSWIKGSGLNSVNPKFISKEGKLINSGPSTTFSEYSVVSENRVFDSPANYPEELLPQFGCAWLTGAGMVLSNFDLENMAEELSVLVIGFGGVGTGAALVLKSFPNVEITILEKSQQRQELAKKLGFSRVYSDLIQYREFNEGKQFDYCMESSGSVLCIQEGFQSLKDQGTIVFASHPKNGELISIDPYELIKGKTIKGTWGGGLQPDSALIKIKDRLKGANIDFNNLIGPKFTLESINEGLNHLESAGANKPIIDFGDLN